MGRGERRLLERGVPAAYGPRMAPRKPLARTGVPVGPPEEGLGVVLGIDPGTAVMGYGALRWVGRRPRIVEAGTIEAKRGRELPERLAFLLGGLEDVLDATGPAVVVVERAFIGRNVQTALRLGEGRGIVLASAARRGLVVAEVTPAEVKRALVGNGQAEKSQVAAMVGRELEVDLDGSPADTTDALAVALTWVHGRVRRLGARPELEGLRISSRRR